LLWWSQWVEDVEEMGVAGRRIKKFNEISRSSNVEILEINFSHLGSNMQAVQSMQKALKMLGTGNGCTIGTGRCIQ
jgi:hypothetical protein